VTRHATGTDAVFNCANPPTTLANGLAPIATRCSAAEISGSKLVTSTTSTPTDVRRADDAARPLSADYEKAQVRHEWLDANEPRHDGRIRARVRASTSSVPVRRAISGCSSRASSRTRVARSWHIDAPHSWNYTKDVAHTLVTAPGRAILGRAWHAPANPACTCARPLTTSTYRRRHERQDHQGPDAGAARVGVVQYRHSRTARRCTSSRSVHHRRLRDTNYFGLVPTPWDEVLSRPRVLFRLTARGSPLRRERSVLVRDGDRYVGTN